MRKIEKNKKTFKKAKLLWFLAAPFIAAVIFVTVEMASSGATLSKLEKEEAYLVSENQKLGDELVRASSLSQFEDVSVSLGFGKPANIVYITEKDIVAKLP
jgi:hypothetical protein